MKTISRSDLVKLLNERRDNEVYVEFDGCEVPIKEVKFYAPDDQIRIVLDPQEVVALKLRIKETPMRGNLNK